MYIEITEALDILSKQQKRRKEVLTHWAKQGNPFPYYLNPQQQYGFLARHLAVCNRESWAFAGKCQEVGLVPFWTELAGDKYVIASTPKTSYLHLQLGDGGKLRLAKPTDWEGKKLSEIKIKNGQKLVDFHHQKWEKIPAKKIRQDWSNWCLGFGLVKDYYFATFSIYAVSGILFKDFHEKGKLTSTNSDLFTKEVVEPAIKKVEEVFGLKVLIYQFAYRQGFKIFPTINREEVSNG